MASTAEMLNQEDVALSSNEVQVISLNALRKGGDNNYHRLEIPVALAKPKASQESLAASNKFCSLRVDPLTFNSNC